MSLSLLGMSPDAMDLIYAMQAVLRGGAATACSPDCNGGYCDHYQNAEDDDDDFTEQEEGMT